MLPGDCSSSCLRGKNLGLTLLIVFAFSYRSLAICRLIFCATANFMPNLCLRLFWSPLRAPNYVVQNDRLRGSVFTASSDSANSPEVTLRSLQTQQARPSARGLLSNAPFGLTWARECNCKMTKSNCRQVITPTATATRLQVLQERYDGCETRVRGGSTTSHKMP